MTTIYLIRHAQADGNLYRRCQAWFDGLITPVGYKQIDALRQRFMETHFDAVYSSDLYRTMTTAKAIYEPRSLPLHTDPCLREICSGCWEDRPWGELLQEDRELLLAFWRCDPRWHVEGGETFEEVQHRFDNAVKRIASNHPNQTIAIFAHGCIIRATLALWSGIPLERIRDIPHGDNTSVALLEYENDSIRVCSYNNTDHLSGELAHAPHPSSNTDEETAAKIENTSLYFLPFDLPTRQQEYMDAVSSTLRIIEPNDILNRAIAQYEDHPECFFDVMLNKQSIGILQLGTAQEGSDSGSIQLMYLKPDFRYRGLGVQIVGQAVSKLRARGLQYLELSCPKNNTAAMHFFEKHAFSKSNVCDTTLRKYIGY